MIDMNKFYRIFKLISLKGALRFHPVIANWSQADPSPIHHQKATPFIFHTGFSGFFTHHVKYYVLITDLFNSKQLKDFHFQCQYGIDN